VRHQRLRRPLGEHAETFFGLRQRVQSEMHFGERGGQHELLAHGQRFVANLQALCKGIAGLLVLALRQQDGSTQLQRPRLPQVVTGDSLGQCQCGGRIAGDHLQVRVFEKELRILRRKLEPTHYLFRCRSRIARCSIDTRLVGEPAGRLDALVLLQRFGQLLKIAALQKHAIAHLAHSLCRRTGLGCTLDFLVCVIQLAEPQRQLREHGARLDVVRVAFQRALQLRHGIAIRRLLEMSARALDALVGAGPQVATREQQAQRHDRNGAPTGSPLKMSVHSFTVVGE
jgi:hypothetical protein